MIDGSSGRRLRTVLIVVAAVLAVTAMLGPVAGEDGPDQGGQTVTTAATTITSCGTTISSSGLYELGSDLSAGTSDCINVTASDVVLDGMGFTIDGPNAHFGIDVQGSSTLSNVTVRNVSVTAAARGINVDDAVDVHVEAVNTSQNDLGIRFNNVGQSFINDSNASHSPSGAGMLFFSGSNNVTVDNATVTHNPTNGIEVSGRDITINGSLIEDNGDPSNTRTGAGIEPDNANDIFVTSNRIKNNSYAIDERSDSTDVLVRNNRITVQRAGIPSFGGSNWTVVGNNFTLATTTDGPYGMYVTAPDPTIRDNEFYDLNTGVYTYPNSGGPTDDFSVVDNYFQGLGRGLVLSKSRSTVAANQFSDVGRGIQVTDGNRSVLEDNTFVDGAVGIELAGNNQIVNRTEVLGNTIESTSSDAIEVTEAGKTVLRQNTIESAGDDGIEIDGGADTFAADNVVTGSQFWDFKTISDAANTTVENLNLGASTAPDTTVDFDARNVRLSGTSSVPENPDGQDDLGRYVEAESTGANSYLNVTFQYEDGDLTGVDESNISVWDYDGSSWSDLGGTLDPAANEIQVNATSFSTFAPLANATLLKEIWSASTDGRTQYSTPAVGPDRVFVGGLDDTLYAFNRSDGSSEWQFDRSGSLADSSPALGGETVFVGSGGGVLYALNATSGAVRWTYTTDSAIVSSPVVTGGTVYVGSNDGTVLAVDAETGNDDWTEETGAAVLSTLTVDSGSVYVSTDDGRLLSLDASTGGQQWSFDANTEVGHSSPAVGDGVVYFAADRTYAVYATNGTEKWSTDVNGTVGSTPTVQSGFVYVGSADGSVYRLSATDGATTWQLATGGPVGSSPVLVSGRLIVGSDNGTVHAINADLGNEVGYVDLGSPIRSSPAIGDDVAFLGSQSGTVYALANLQVTPTSSSSNAPARTDDASGDQVSSGSGSGGQERSDRGSRSSDGNDDEQCSDSRSRSRGSGSESSCRSDRSR